MIYTSGKHNLAADALTRLINTADYFKASEGVYAFLITGNEDAYSEAQLVDPEKIINIIRKKTSTQSFLQSNDSILTKK